MAEGRSQEKEGGGSGRLGTSLPWVPAPVTWAPDPPLPVGPLVGRSVGRWVSGLQPGSRLSCSEVRGTRERPAHLSPPERSPAPRSVGSAQVPRPAARSGLGARRGIAWDSERPQILAPPAE